MAFSGVQKRGEDGKTSGYLSVSCRPAGVFFGECSGSEYEAMQENYNTIIEKNIENNW